MQCDLLSQQQLIIIFAGDAWMLAQVAKADVTWHSHDEEMCHEEMCHNC